MNEALLTLSSIPLLIDHTLLKPEATQGEIARLCQEARHFGFASVCIHPYWVPFAVGTLQDQSARLCTVIGFPLGANRSQTKIAEAREALTDGARELDMVINIGALRSGFRDVVREEIAALAEIAHERGALLKVILETCLLTQDEKAAACEAAVEAHADFVKTSTGFSASGATEADVKLLRETVGNALGVKASGGIRTEETLRRMVLAGANRIGTSSGVSILRELGFANAVQSKLTNAASSGEDKY